VDQGESEQSHTRLVLLRRLIPWQPLIDRLTPFYHPNKGRNGQSLRTTVAVSIVARLRQLSDEKVIEQVQENRYMQYLCNVPDQGLQTFMNPSTLCRFRKRLGTSGIAIMAEEVFDHLKDAHAIEADMMLQDSTVLESPIIYPTDVRLLYKAFDKMALIAKQAQIKPWWNEAEIKKLWRAYNLDGSKPLAYLCALYLWFEPALETFAAHQHDLPEGALKTQAHELLEALLMLDEQSQAESSDISSSSRAQAIFPIAWSPSTISMPAPSTRASVSPKPNLAPCFSSPSTAKAL
jgi:hypothetical protein